ncbi:MAG: serine protease [Psychromonas sp.]
MKCLLTYLFSTFLATLSLPSMVAAAEISTRIVGGEESEIDQFPWAVSLKDSATLAHFCGGSLIAKQWVLTAAHCLINNNNDTAKSAAKITATVGEYDLDSIPATPSIEIEQFYIHPDFNSTTQVNDIALLKLATAVDDPSLIEPFSIENTIAAVTSQRSVTALGWGSTVAYNPNETVDPDYPNILNHVEIALFTDHMCSSALGNNYTAEMLCAGLEDGGKDSCQGDSGGPLVINQDGSWQQIGIISWGNGCAAEGYPGVYTRLALYEEWVNGILWTSQINISEDSSSSGGGAMGWVTVLFFPLLFLRRFYKFL